jgi:altronate dehydratase
VNAAKQCGFLFSRGKPLQEGMVIMDGLAHDVVSDTGMIGAGAQVSVVFTSGRGTPLVHLLH